jgi:glycine reductase
VLITAMTSMATAFGAMRILPAGRIPHPVGDPSRPPEAEAAWRREVVNRALAGLEAPIEEATVLG